MYHHQLLSPIQWLWLSALKDKIEIGTQVNLNRSLIGRDSVLMLILMMERIVESLPRKSFYDLLDEGDRDSWIAYWFQNGDSIETLATELGLESEEVEAILRRTE